MGPYKVILLRQSLPGSNGNELITTHSQSSKTGPPAPDAVQHHAEAPLFCRRALFLREGCSRCILSLTIKARNRVSVVIK